MMASLFGGAWKCTLASRCPSARTLTFPGAPGTASGLSFGVTAIDDMEGALIPFTLVAVTVKVYGRPFCSPLSFTYPILQKPTAERETVGPFDAVTVYVCTGASPSNTEGLQVTRANPLP